MTFCILNFSVLLINLQSDLNLDCLLAILIPQYCYFANILQLFWNSKFSESSNQFSTLEIKKCSNTYMWDSLSQVSQLIIQYISLRGWMLTALVLLPSFFSSSRRCTHLFIYSIGPLSRFVTHVPRSPNIIHS